MGDLVGFASLTLFVFAAFTPPISNMSLVDQIRKLLDQGDYLKAASLADDHKITDCRNICKNVGEINEIASSIEDSVSILSSLEEKINGYDSELRNVKDTAFKMEEKEHAVQVQCKNLSDTCSILGELLENLHIPDHVQKVLLDCDLNDENSVHQVERTLEQFERVLHYKPDPSLHQMRCIKDQKEHANSIKSKFCELFYQHFTQYVEDFLSEFSESFINNIYSHAITMPGHDVIHNHLLYLARIVGWIWRNDRSTHQALRNFYISRSKTQYDKELKTFFECAKERMGNPTRHHGRISELSAESRKRNSITTGDSSTRASSLSGGGGNPDTQDAASGKSSEISYTGWDEFDAYLEEILHAIEPTCLSEQRFYSTFFITNQDAQKAPADQGLVRMFSLLESEFIEFANYYNSQNGLYSLYLLVRLSQYLSAQEDSNFFIAHTYREVRIIVKRNFDNFMEQQLNTIRDLKPPKQPKCGVLSVVKNFEQFARQVEALFKSSGARRTDVDRWYLELVAELFRIIDRIEHSKTPTEMIRLENYNYLHDVLRSIKVPCLEAQRKEANVQYKAALNAYVTRYFGRPLEKLNVFFEGVQAKVAQGVKEEEISFQLAFSKQELRKVLQMVTLKEVRRGLEEMYRRIEKHAYEPESNLIQVIWHAMQEEFLSQYKAIQGMIERCYPSTNLSLTFTIDDVLQVFSNIAQLH